MLDTYWPLALGLILIAGFGAWVFMHSNRSYLLRWALIPAALVVAVVSAKVYDARLGYAMPGELPERFVYLAHQVVVEKNRKSGIEVWARTGATRLYRIPYSKPVEAAMDRAREQAKEGPPVVMRRVRNEEGPAAGDTGLPPHAANGYESKLMLPSDLNPKT